MSSSRFRGLPGLVGRLLARLSLRTEPPVWPGSAGGCLAANPLDRESPGAASLSTPMFIVHSAIFLLSFPVSLIVRSLFWFERKGGIAAGEPAGRATRGRGIARELPPVCADNLNGEVP